MIDEIHKESNTGVRGAGTFKLAAFLITQVRFPNYIFISFFQWVLYLNWSLLLVTELRRQNEDLKSELQYFEMETKSLLRCLNTNVQNLYPASAIMQNSNTLENGHHQGRGDVRTIPLLKCSRTLEVEDVIHCFNTVDRKDDAFLFFSSISYFFIFKFF